jgi:hypothetical protein
MKEPWKYFKKNQITRPFVVALMKIYFIQKVKIKSLAAELTAVLSKYYETSKGKGGTH